MTSLPPTSGLPNVLWVCTDQQRFDTLAITGNPHLRTPHLDQLACGGVTFTHAFCQSPICTPSRASFLTGMYPSSVHGCMNGNVQWSGAAPLISQLLANRGYHTGLVGKLHLSGAANRIEPRPADDGYAWFEWSHHPQDDWPQGHAYADWLRASGLDPRIVAQTPEELPPQFHQTTWCVDRAIEFITRAERPWFLSVNLYDPHPPFDPPRSYRERYDAARLPPPAFRESDLAAQARLAAVDFQTKAARPETFAANELKAAYYAMIEQIDDHIGRLLAALDRTSQRSNTLVIFMSDHGEMLGDHGLRWKGCRFYEGLVRVPLIMSWPGRFRTDLRCPALVELIDLAPTLLELAGTAVPERMQGRSLVPLLTGAGATAGPHRDQVRCEYYHALNPARLPASPGRVRAHGYGTMLRTERYKLCVYHGIDHGELFDLQDDPNEHLNRWDDPAYREIRFDLLKRSFDQLALAVDLGPPQTQWY